MDGPFAGDATGGMPVCFDRNDGKESGKTFFMRIDCLAKGGHTMCLFLFNKKQSKNCTMRSPKMLNTQL